jgi:hypothetical protein
MSWRKWMILKGIDAHDLAETDIHDCTICVYSNIYVEISSFILRKNGKFFLL